MAPTRAEVGESTRSRIAHVANELFETHGFEATAVRTIASAAGIDPAQVIRHFGSKEQLFLHTVGIKDHFDPAITGPLEGLGNRLVSYVLAPEHDRMRRAISSLVLASDRDGVRERLRETIRDAMVDRLEVRLQGRDRVLRSELIAAQLGGLIQAWSIVRDPRLLEASREQIVALYGAAIQRLVDAES
jgi:AcrR family transcriptional regulator